MTLQLRQFFSLLIPAFLLSSGLQAQHADKDNGNIKGTITTNDGQPAAAVTARLKQTDKTTLSEDNGSFTLRNIKPGDYELQISLIGYQDLHQLIKVEAGKTSLVKIQLLISDKQLQEVIISSSHNKFRTGSSQDAAKMPLANLENPQVYTSISKEALQEQGIFSADDAVRNSPGISKLWSATGRVGDGGAYYSLRGFTVQTQLRNGLAGGISNTIDAANLERLEVIKGPSGTLYGNSLTSYGGLLNRITKRPYDHLGGEIDFSAGSYNFNRVSADINTPLDSAKRALLRINTAYNSIGSFQDNGFSKNFAFDPSFTLKVNDRLTLTFEAEINHGTGTTPVMYFFGTTVADLGVNRADQLSMDYKKSYQTGDLIETIDNTGFYGQAEYRLSDHWVSKTNFSTTTSKATGPEAYFYLQPGNDSISRNVWTVDGTSNVLQIQQNFIGDFQIGRMRNRLVAGLDFMNESANIRYIDPNGGSDFFDMVNTKGAIPNYNDFDQAGANALYQNQPKTTSYNRYNNYNYSVYASDVLNITDNLLAMASVRANYFTTKPLADPTTDQSDQSFHQVTFSPKFGLVYQVIKDKVALFGNYMNGFSNPGYNLAYNEATNSNVAKLFKAEQANQWEGGVKIDEFNGKLSSTISYYDIQVMNKVRPDAQHANASVQDGTQYSKGIEAEISVNPIPGFNLLAGYAHNTSKMEKSSDYDNGRRPQTAGPANTGNLWVSYTIVSGTVKGLGIGFGGNYAGDNQVINNSYNGVFTLPAYTILNTGIFYNQPKFRVAVNINNLTDKKYWIGYTTVNPQMLRQVTGTLSYKF